MEAANQLKKKNIRSSNDMKLFKNKKKQRVLWSHYRQQ
jgi:hypothetical protein